MNNYQTPPQAIFDEMMKLSKIVWEGYREEGKAYSDEYVDGKLNFIKSLQNDSDN